MNIRIKLRRFLCLIILFIMSSYAQQPATNTITGTEIISGFIKDKETGEPIAYGNVWLDKTALGSSTDVHGYYVINGIASGQYKIIIAILGYKTVEQQINVQPGAEQRFDFELEPELLEADAIVVSAERLRFKEDIEISSVNIGRQEIINTPAFIETDVFRTVQQLPSVTSQNDFSSALVVRGGSPDENLILLDGAEIYNPYHLVGLFSTFNADAISDAEFLAGGYSAEYTGRLSSVLNITSREGNSKQGKLFKDTKFGEYWDFSRGKADISLLSSRTMAEGPFYNGAWILSGRRTYFDLLADLAGQGEGWDYYFYDYQFKIFSDLNKQNRVTFSTFNGRDILNFKLDDDDFDTKINFDWGWGNNSTSFNWRYIPNASILSEFTLTRSSFDFDVDLQSTTVDSITGRRSETNINIINKIEDITATEKLTWFLSAEHTLTTGLAIKNLTMKFDLAVDNINFFDLKQEPDVFSVWIQDKWKINSLLSLQFGLRGSKYELHDKLYLDPRLGFKYLLNEDLSLKGSWGMYNQFLFTTNNDDEILQIVDFWQSIPREFDAMSNQHFILGLEKWFEQGFTGSVEAYYKPYSNVFTNNPNNDPAVDNDEFLAGKGHAWGLELLLKKTSGKLTGWLGYSYTDIERRFDFNNDGKIRRTDNQMSEIYQPKYSKPHLFNLVVSYKHREDIQVSMSWTVSSGQPYTPVVGKVFYGGFDLDSPYGQLIDLQGQRYSSRYPLYLRGDISMTKDITLFGMDGKLKLQVLNFTNHYNVLTYIWDHNSSPSKVKSVSMFPILPSIGFEFEF